jgi:hypothetical protein
MKGDSKVTASIGNAVQTKVITHICHLARLVCRLGYDLHWPLLLVIFWESISSLGQIAAENLHQAVRLSVIVDR